MKPLSPASFNINRPRSGFFLVLGIGFLVLGIESVSEDPFQIAGWLGVLIFSLSIVCGGQRWLDKKPFIEIGENGVISRDFAPNVIPWDSIHHIYFYKFRILLFPIPIYWIHIEVDSYDNFYQPSSICGQISRFLRKYGRKNIVALQIPLAEKDEREFSRIIDHFLPKDQNPERYANWEKSKPNELYL